jgi:hypothetical protein
LEDWFINTEILPTIEHQAHIRSLLGNIGQDIETSVNLDFYVYACVNGQCYSPYMRCHNRLSFSYELREHPGVQHISCGKKDQENRQNSAWANEGRQLLAPAFKL